MKLTADAVGKPFADFQICPVRCFIVVTLVAGIGGADAFGQIGSGNSKRVVMTTVGPHIETGGHVTVDAL